MNLCKKTGATVQIIGEGPSQTTYGKKFTVEGEGDHVTVEESILTLTHAGRKLPSDYRRESNGTLAG